MSHENVFQERTPTRFGIWAVAAVFCSKLPTREILISHISANNKDMKLILVFFFVFNVKESKYMYDKYVLPSIMCFKIAATL